MTRLAIPEAAETTRGAPVRAATAVYDTENPVAKRLFRLKKAVFIMPARATAANNVP